MKDPWKKLLHNVKISGRRAKAMTLKRKNLEIEVDITIDDLKQIYDTQDGKCFWFDIPLDINFILEKGNLLSMSADRIDNNIGYTKDNIVICSRFANLGRQNCEFDKFKAIINHIKNNEKI